ncbi:hypothetical protein [Rhizobium sp. MHM7A]|uniref:hypothetical protein n=1 Tax=Rhizobium sp. MHM7A TaxID=2583233 RepID=UPI00110630A8|nr:hypothetical protein [Rhizobium sp. MHM7A]TLX17191.1 hypothetical protein FFR93_07730 [Rhizobium sp. MHM7A]
MKTNTDIAARAFSEKLEWAKAYGKQQVDHHYRVMTERFNEEAFIALGAGLIDDLRTKWAECVENGVIDRGEDKNTEISAVTLANAQGLSVRFDDGDHLVFAWQDEKDLTIIAAVPWRDEPPAELMAELRETVAGGITYRELTPLARKFSKFTAIPYETGAELYSELPRTLSKVVERLNRSRIENEGYSAGLGYCRERKMSHGISMWDGTGGRNHFVVNYAEKVLSKFNISQDVEINRGEEHLQALRESQLEALFASSCAMAFGYHLKKHMDDIKEIVSKSHDLGLSSELVFAHSDRDVHVFGERFGDRELYVNNNVDGDDPTLATVITHEEGEPSRVDVYLASPWGLNFEQNFGCSPDTKVRPGMENEYVEYLATNTPPLTTEIEIVRKLRAGELPTEGLAFSYDIASKTIEITPLAADTRYLAHLPLDVKTDLERLTAVLNGDHEIDEMGFKKRSPCGSIQDIEISDHFARRPVP